MASDEPDFEPDGGGSRLRLKVAAGASRRRVAGAYAGALKLSVTTAPERGKANREVLALVAETFGVAPGSVELLRGETSPEKVVRLPIPPEEARALWGVRARGRAAPR